MSMLTIHEFATSERLRLEALNIPYKVARYGDAEIPYDPKAPCLICGEPVREASMGGTAICPSCDMGHCRYCGITTVVLREELDGGSSKRALLAHMAWHHTKPSEPRTPEAG